VGADEVMRARQAAIAALTALAFTGASILIVLLLVSAERILPGGPGGEGDTLVMAVGMPWAFLTMYGAGLVFSLELGLGGRFAGVPGSMRQAPWLSMGLGQPLLFVGSFVSALMLRGRICPTEQACISVAMWAMTCGALLLVASVARWRSGRWSALGLAWMTGASLVWPLVFEGLSQWCSTHSGFGDNLSVALAVGTWQVLFAAAYAWWVWPTSTSEP
jgi:hypothetical protein